MSLHLILCARHVTGLPASSKLLLLCMAENARDDRRRIASPGHGEMRLWTGLKDSQLYNTMQPLYETRLLRQHRRGQKHVRAEYVVFPDGCCDRHGPISLPGEPDAEQEHGRSGSSDADASIRSGVAEAEHSVTSDAEGRSCGQPAQSDAEGVSASDADLLSIRSAPSQPPANRMPPVKTLPENPSQGLPTSTTEDGRDPARHTVITLRPRPVQNDDCEHGFDRYVGCRQCRTTAGASR